MKYFLEKKKNICSNNSLFDPFYIFNVGQSYSPSVEKIIFETTTEQPTEHFNR